MPRLTRAQKQAETRSQLIEAAVKVFAERGYSEARIEAIAEAAGFSKGAFYSNFESKEELVLAVLEQTMLSRTDLMSDAVASAGHDGGRLIEAIVAEVLDQEGDRPWNLLRLELLRQAARDPGVRAAIATHCTDLLSANARVIEDVRQRLELKPLPQPRLLADIFFATALGASLLRFAGVEVAPVGTIALMLLSLLVTENPLSPVLAVGARQKRTARAAHAPRAADRHS